MLMKLCKLIMYAAGFIWISILLSLPCYCQNFGNGLGNATVITPVTASDPYGTSMVNSAISGEIMSTRHSRSYGSSGIGGSFIGTESVTSETKPIKETSMVQPSHTPAINDLENQLQNTRRMFSQNMLASPALSKTPAAPTFTSELKFPEFNNTYSSSESLMSNPYNQFWSHKKSGKSLEYLK